jgi:hypothetical protein
MAALGSGDLGGEFASPQLPAMLSSAAQASNARLALFDKQCLQVN